MMRKYEIMYIVDQDTQEAEIKEINTKLDGILTANGGKIIESKDWGLKEFAYEINHKKKGYYFVQIVETSAENIAEFRRVTKINKAVVRALIVNTELDSDYIQSTEYAKTDMTKFEEERHEKRPFKRPSRYQQNQNAENRDGQTRPYTRKPAVKKTENVVKTDKTDDNK